MGRACPPHANVLSVSRFLERLRDGPVVVADLAPARLRGRYMALSTISWEIGFVIGPAAGGFILAASPLALWPIAALVCVAAGAGALALERGIPRELRLTPA